MRKILIACFLLVLFFGFNSCATMGIAQTPNPPENIIIMVNMFGLDIPVLIEKGFFDDKTNWITEREFEALKEKLESVIKPEDKKLGI